LQIIAGLELVHDEVEAVFIVEFVIILQCDYDRVAGALVVYCLVVVCPCVVVAVYYYHFNFTVAVFVALIG